MKIQILVPFLIYLFLLIILGFYLSHSVPRGMSGFFLGGRKINRFAAAISSVISARGAWILLGVSTQAYIIGLSSVWLVVGFILSEILLILFLAPALRKFSEEHDCLTLVDIFTSRFDGEKSSLRIVISIVFLLFSLIFISAQFMAGGSAFYAMLGLTLTNGIIITGVIALFYAFLGGFKTINYSDVFHSFLIIFILICLPVIILMRREGWENLHSEIILSAPHFFNIKYLSIGTLAGFLSVGLGSPGNPNILLKYMSVNDSKHFRSMAIVNTLTNILLAAGAIIIGIFAKAYFPDTDSIPGAAPQNVFIGISGMVFPPFVIGIVLVSIIATIISATGSQILFSASTLVNDIFEKTSDKGKHASQAKLAFYSKIAIVVIVYIGILAGVLIDTDIYRFILFALAGLGATIGPAVIFTLFWKGTSMPGIIAGVISGGLTVFIWKSIPFLSDSLYEFAPGFIMACTAIWMGSTIDKSLRSRNYNRKANYEDIKKAGNFE